MSDNNDAKAVTITPALTALIKPTADYLGTELRDYVRVNVEKWKSKRQEQNLQAQLTSVVNKIDVLTPKTGDRSVTTVQQLELFSEWVEGVQNVDPEDTELSEIWQNLLLRAASGEHIETELLNTIRLISPSEASFLMRFQKRRPLYGLTAANLQDKHLALSLREKKILERDYRFLTLVLFSIPMAGAFLYAINLPLRSDVTPIMIMYLSVSVLVGIVFSLRHLQFRLTWLGRQILKRVNDDGVKDFGSE